MTIPLAQTPPVILQDVPWDLLFRIGLTGAVLLLILVGILTGVLFYLRIRNSVRSRRWSLLEAQWEPLLLEIIHEGRSPEILWDTVEPEDVPFLLRYLTRFAERVKGVELVRIQAVSAPYLETVLPSLRDGDPEPRALAVKKLGILGLEAFTSEVVAALDDPSPLVRFIAARALLASGRPNDAEQVVFHLDRFGSWSGDAIAGLLSVGGPDVASLLRGRLEDLSTPAKTAVIVGQALRGMEDPAAADACATVLEKRSEREVLLECLRLIGTVGRAQHAPFVRPFVDDPDFVIRAQALGALGRVGRRSDAELMAEAIDDPSPWVALRAAKALASMGEFDRLRELARTSKHGADFALQAAEEARH